MAFGFVNIVGSFFGAMPTFASLTRSSIADQAKVQRQTRLADNVAQAKTNFFGFLVAVFVVLTLGLLIPLFKFLPRSVMAAIVICAAMGLIDLHQVHYIVRVRAWSDGVLMLLVWHRVDVQSAHQC